MEAIPPNNRGPNNRGPVGVFDSGVGGLSVWRELVRAMPCEDFMYLADQAHVPYGPRASAEIARFSLAMTRFLLGRGCKAVVVACNTASAAALKLLRESFPHTVIIGLEPAVKPAVALTRRGVVGVMATPGTFDGRLFRETARRHAAGVRLITQACAGLAERIEAGQLDDDATHAELRAHLAPMLAAGADVVVLACTHYPFARAMIEALVGPGCHVLDPAPAVARHVARCLLARQLLTPHTAPGHTVFLTTGAVDRFAAALRRLVDVTEAPAAAHWQSDDTIVDTGSAAAAGAVTRVA